MEKKSKETKLIEAIINSLLDTTQTKSDILKMIDTNSEELNINKDLLSAENIKEIEDEEERNIDIDIIYSKDKKMFEVSDILNMDASLRKSFVAIPTKEEARYITDIRTQMQKRRIAVQNQLRSINQKKDQDSDEIVKPSKNIKTKNKVTENRPFLEWYLFNLINMEKQLDKALDAFSDCCYMSKWAKANVGIGPIIATQLTASLDIVNSNSNEGEVMRAGNWWSYCGLNDNKRPWLGKEKSKQLVEEAIEENGGILNDDAVYILCQKSGWKFSYYNEKCKNSKGEWDKIELIKSTSVIPYNKSMKVLMYHIGESFVKLHNKDNCFYGKIYEKRLAYEKEKNLRGDYADQAAEGLKRVSKNTVAYKYYAKGQLPPQHLANRAKRVAVKMFISHLFEAEYYNKFGKQAPQPYIIAYNPDKHYDYIPPAVPYDSFERDEI